MKLRFLLAFILFLNAIPKQNIYSQEKKKTVAVLEFSSSSAEVGRGELTTLANRFRTILVKTDAFDVLERQKMSDILKEQDFTLSDNCNSAECAVQVGQLLGVELMIAGDVGKLGDTYSIDLRLISVTTGKIIQTEGQNYEGKIDGLFDPLTTIANSFAGVKSGTLNSGTQIAADGTFTDPRDGKKYKTVKIGSQIWMAENLNYYIPSSSWYYDNSFSKWEKYGRLYDWQAANVAAPSGWHLPNKSEWKTLMTYFRDQETAFSKLIRGGGAEFDALFGGYMNEDGEFKDESASAYFWSSSEDSVNEAWRFYLGVDDEKAFINTDSKKYGFSVRLVKD